MLHRRYTLSARTRIVSDSTGRHLRCTYPLQSIALNESAALLLLALRPDRSLADLAQGVTPETVVFLDGLVQRGALQATYRVEPPVDLPRVEVIVPAYIGSEPARLGLRSCLAALARQRYDPERLRITVVDDASPDALQETLPAPQGPAFRVLRHERNAGPADARNTGAATPWPDHTAAPVLAFIDADAEPHPDWLGLLTGLLEDPAIDAAAGAVRGRSTTSLLEQYENACSSLYLGESPGAVGLPDGALSYLPSCNLAIRRSAFESAGGFRPGWRWAEDVDLSWRLRDAGHGLFYHPAARVTHAHRATWSGFMARRRAYAASEAMLRRVHPGRFRYRWALIPCTLFPGLGGALIFDNPSWLFLSLVGTAVSLALPGVRQRLSTHRIGGRWPATTLLAAGFRRTAAAAIQEARRLNRQALWLWAPALLFWPRLAALGALVFVLGACGEWLARRPRLAAVTFAIGYAWDCLAYSVGRMEGRVAQAAGRLRGSQCEG